MEAGVLVQAALCRGERLADGNGQFLMALVVDDQLAARDAQIDPHLEETAVAVMLAGARDSDMAADETIVETLQLDRLLADDGLDRGGQRDFLRGDGERKVHYGLLRRFDDSSPRSRSTAAGRPRHRRTRSEAPMRLVTAGNHTPLAQRIKEGPKRRSRSSVRRVRESTFRVASSTSRV